jgi:hypothetical protein
MERNIILCILLMMSTSLLAQRAKDQSWSVFSGGMILDQSKLSTTKLAYEKKHFGLSTDFTYDTYYEKWTDGTQSTFSLYGVSIAARLYSQQMGRGLFAEGFGGYGLAKLTTSVNDLDNKIKADELFPVTGFGFGYRLGKKPKGLFGEIAYRATIPLKNVHLYTTDEKPDPQGLDNISYQSWIFEKGKPSGQLYVGIGYSF